MTAILDRGWRALFGRASDDLWQVYASFGVPKPGPDAFPIQLFGDEVEIFDNHQWMCLNWSAETSPVHSDAKASRYLICAIPVHSYLMRCEGKKKLANITLQECLRIVVSSFNDLTATGISAVVCVKGDWKFLVQALSSKFSASFASNVAQPKISGARTQILPPLPTGDRDNAKKICGMSALPWQTWTISHCG